MERALFFSGLLLLASVYASVRGGKPERLAALMYLTAFAASALSAQLGHRLYYTINWGIVASDIALAVSLAALALRANRYWTIWATSIQIVGIIAHLAKLIVPEIAATAYEITLLVWSYAAIPVLMIATYRHRERVMRFGLDANWSAA
jgi:hypothetical protein